MNLYISILKINGTEILGKCGVHKEVVYQSCDVWLEEAYGNKDILEGSYRIVSIPDIYKYCEKDIIDFARVFLMGTVTLYLLTETKEDGSIGNFLKFVNPSYLPENNQEVLPVEMIPDLGVVEGEEEH